MIAWSRTHAWVAGLALILASNAVVLIGVAHNRSGTPDTVLTLTQRELALPYGGYFERESSGLALRLQWRVLSQGTSGASDSVIAFAGVGGTPPWLDKAKLANLGFDVSKSVDTPEGRRYYEKLLPRDVVVVLELAGPDYQAALDRARRQAQREEALLEANVGNKEFEQRVRSARAEFDREESLSSRLFVVDAGRDAAALRARYPDPRRYAFMRGRVQPVLVTERIGARLSGYLSSIHVSEINVPRVYRPILEPMLEVQTRGMRVPLGAETTGWDRRSLPQYEVSVTFGKRLEPWITGISVPPRY